MKSIIILYTDAGGGHKSAALTLQETIQKTTGWRVQVINPFVEWCSEYDLIKKFTKIPAEDFYNKHVSAKNNPLFSLLAIAALFMTNLSYHAPQIKSRLIEKWIDCQPDMVISVSPFINKIIIDSFENFDKISFVTLITDFKECFPKIWLVSNRQHVLCCSEKIVQQALKRKIRIEHIHKLSGMPINGNFYLSNKIDRNILRNTYDLMPNIPTGLVIFGSHGNQDMLTIAKNMQGFNQPIQMIFICGHNEALRAQILNLTVDYRLVATGFVGNVYHYMRCADFIISKPGGLSIAEAAVMGLPQILKANFYTLLQEKYNATWVAEHKIGIIVSNFRKIKNVVANVLNNLDLYHAKLQFIENKSFFELPEILNKILE